MNAGMRSAGCWPSESMVSACVKPAACAWRMPSSTAAPLPWFTACTITRRPGSCWAISRSQASLPSVLPSTTTHTGFQWRRAARTVSMTVRPGL